MNGTKRPKVASPTYFPQSKCSVPSSVPQRSPSVVTDPNLKRLNPYLKLNGDSNPAIGQCVDTKRLELAIAGSGARIKVCHLSFLAYFLLSCVERSDFL